MPHQPKSEAAYKTSTKDSGLYEAGYREFMRRSTVRTAVARAIGDHIAKSRLFNRSASAKIMDLGCNDGEMTRLYVSAILSHFPQLSLAVDLLEPARAALEIAREKVSSLGTATTVTANPMTVAQFIEERAKDSPKYDLVSALWLFYHVKPELIGSLLTLLEPDGQLLIAMGGGNHPIKSSGVLVGASNHGDYRIVEDWLAKEAEQGGISYQCHAVRTEINLTGLWVLGQEATPNGINFFSFMYNLDYMKFSPELKQALDSLMAEVLANQHGKVFHDHYLYWVARR